LHALVGQHGNPVAGVLKGHADHAIIRGSQPTWACAMDESFVIISRLYSIDSAYRQAWRQTGIPK
jgi:hypothetical protein